jgi:ADP-ribose pyrophosphatase YjhB (NUDIX family)
MDLTEEHCIPQLSIDCVVFGYQDSKLKVLIAQLNHEEEVWTLPGGFILQNEDIDSAAKRILADRTGLKEVFLEQFKVFGRIDRINNSIIDRIEGIINTNNDTELKKWLEWFSKRFVSIGYYALVDTNKVNLKIGEFDKSVCWIEINELPPMIMDHNEMVKVALKSLRLDLDKKLIGFNLLPETFTMRELQELYEAVYNKLFARNNFQKKILDLGVLERLEKKYTGAANKAPFLYCFIK